MSGYWVSDAGFDKRAQLSINGDAQLSLGIDQAAGLTTLKTILDGVRAAYLTGARPLLEKNSFSLGNVSKSGKINFDLQYSDEEGTFAIG